MGFELSFGSTEDTDMSKFTAITEFSAALRCCEDRGKARKGIITKDGDSGIDKLYSGSGGTLVNLAFDIGKDCITKTVTTVEISQISESDLANLTGLRVAPDTSDIKELLDEEPHTVINEQPVTSTQVQEGTYYCYTFGDITALVAKHTDKESGKSRYVILKDSRIAKRGYLDYLKAGVVEQRSRWLTDGLISEDGVVLSDIDDNIISEDELCTLISGSVLSSPSSVVKLSSIEEGYSKIKAVGIYYRYKFRGIEGLVLKRSDSELHDCKSRYIILRGSLIDTNISDERDISSSLLSQRIGYLNDGSVSEKGVVLKDIDIGFLSLTGLGTLIRGSHISRRFEELSFEDGERERERLNNTINA